MTHGIALTICVMSFMFLALAMDRHQAMLSGRELTRAQSRGLRTAGWCGLVLALRYLAGVEGWALGIVSYSGCTSLAAGIVYGGLILRERRAMRG